jgi:hypothetical protein
MWSFLKFQQVWYWEFNCGIYRLKKDLYKNNKINTITESPHESRIVMSYDRYSVLCFHFITSIALFYFTHSLFEGTNLNKQYYL